MRRLNVANMPYTWEVLEITGAAAGWRIVIVAEDGASAWTEPVGAWARVVDHPTAASRVEGFDTTCYVVPLVISDGDALGYWGETDGLLAPGDSLEDWINGNQTGASDPVAIACRECGKALREHEDTHPFVRAVKPREGRISRDSDNCPPCPAHEPKE